MWLLRNVRIEDDITVTNYLLDVFEIAGHRGILFITTSL